MGQRGWYATNSPFQSNVFCFQYLKDVQVSPEGLHFTNKARAINGLAEMGGRGDEIAALMDLYRSA